MLILLLKVAVAWLTMVMVLALLERSLTYFPVRYPGGDWGFPDRAATRGLRVEDRFMLTADGLRLHGWWCLPAAAPDPEALPVLLVFHGNAGNIAHRGDLLERFAGLPARVLLVDYRGYGRSEGRPSEAGLHQDARAAWRHLTVQQGVPAERITVLGKSLGGAVAVLLAAEVQPAGLVVQSSFTSLPDVAVRVFPFLPRRFIRARFDAREAIARVRCPILVLHSQADEVVPFELGRRLFEAAPLPKHFVDLSPARHNDPHLVVPRLYFETLGAFLTSPAERPATP